MPAFDQANLARLTEKLAGLVSEAGTPVERDADATRIAGGDLALAVVGVWDNPSRPAGEGWRAFGAQIEIRGAALFDGPVIEYSYGGGENDDEAETSALRRWVDYDLPVLVEALTGETDKCQLVQFASDGAGAIAAGTWRVFLGPLHYVAGAHGAQPCCQTCLFAMSMPALMPLLAAPVSCAIKIVASKDGDGATSADCRRNGEDVPEAIARIAEAAGEWPTIEGLQMRRQYLYFRAPA